jgi:hypothetical protein
VNDGRTEGTTEGEGDDEADEEAAEATIVAVRSEDGDGSAATRMPQPASNVAAPAAASTLARHLSLTSASSMLAVFFAATRSIPPGSGDGLAPHAGPVGRV